MAKNKKRFPADEYLELLRQGGGRDTSARALGLKPQAVADRLEADPGFALSVREAETAANEAVEEALFLAATSGNVKAAELWLKHRSPDRWGNDPVTPPDSPAQRLASLLEARLRGIAESESQQRLEHQ
jgi:hypothetical protein